jgi:GH25 family lysozyme M1 (1,4-beta-N-acetylmuramidase)
MSARSFIATLSALALSFSLVSPAAANEREAALSMSGPGIRIHGADVSRWQHPNGKLINFKKMHKAGLRFLLIKASDTRSESDRIARKYLYTDRREAQKVGIYTGFYHYAVLPDVTTIEALTADAQRQARQVIARIKSLGGYNSLDLPYALDLENNCVKYGANSSCAKYASRKFVTEWAKSFLATVRDATNRTPIFYSYPAFLENAMQRDAELAQYPLWLAQYAVDPFPELSAPGVKRVGCYVHSWTNSSCKSEWVIWQYSSCGTASKYGVPGNRLDLNVFRGEPRKFLELADGTWSPSDIEFMPFNETTTIKLDYLTATTHDKDVLASVQVFRPDGSPVVTGEMKFFLIVAGEQVTFRQKALRVANGMWKLEIKGLAAGNYSGEFRFSDVSNTHRRIKVPVNFTITQNPDPIVAPSPEPEVSPKARPGDSCRGQFKS